MSSKSTKSWQNSKKIDQKWDKNKNNGFGLGPQFLIIKFNKMNQNEWNLIIKLNENWAKWYKNKVAVTGSNQWKFDYNLPKIQWNISLISKPENQWKVIIKFNQNQCNLIKYWPKFNPILWSNSEKITSNHVLPLTQKLREISYFW